MSSLVFKLIISDFFSFLSLQVGVQTMIEPNAGATALEEKVDAAHPITVGREEGDTAKKK